MQIQGCFLNICQCPCNRLDSADSENLGEICDAAQNQSKTITSQMMPYDPTAESSDRNKENPQKRVNNRKENNTENNKKSP